MTLSYPSHIPSTRFPTGTVLALPAAFWFKDYHPYLSQYFSSCGSHYLLIRQNVLEYRARFELATLRICNPLQLTTLPPIHNHNILKHTTHRHTTPFVCSAMCFKMAYRQGFEPRTAGFGDQNSAN
jgi:hypothetical protein